MSSYKNRKTDDDGFSLTKPVLLDLSSKDKSSHTQSYLDYIIPFIQSTRILCRTLGA